MNTGLRASLSAAALGLLLAGCGGGGGGNSNAIPSPNALTAADVQQVIAQAVAEAKARSKPATIAVVDRVGNVLGVFAMNGAPASFKVTIDPSGQTTAVGGLEGVVLPSPLAAIAKAVTGAYLSSAGNAFSTRTASQIVQSHFNPQEFDQPGGPLFGVQFSSLPCSDVVQPASMGQLGPKSTPIGLAADPGGLPLYKNGTLVGGIGVLADGFYTVDLDIIDTDTDSDELIAVAGTYGFAAPTDIRAERITVDGRSLRYVDSEATVSNPAAAPPTLTGGVLVNPIAPGVAFDTPASGYAPDPDPAFAGKNAYTLVDAAGMPRYAPKAGTDGLLTRAEVVAILANGLDIANRERAQIRRPTGSAAQVSVVVVDTKGEILGLTRTPDAPVFGTDVAVQKARTAGFFSSVTAAAELKALPPANQTPPVAIGSYVTQMQTFLSDPTSLANGIAYSNRSVGNLARPFFPDGIEGRPNGPLSKPFPSQWSPFNDGLQLDLVINAVTGVGAPASGCTGNARIRNGIQIFPGSFPIYRGAQLIGAVGVSGDGIDQDDMVGFLGLANAGTALGNSIANAPSGIRADTIAPQGEGSRLRYANCPQAPFNDSTQQNACAGI
jgi:uncharacterized protein GlcG (DUF336 family)